VSHRVDQPTDAICVSRSGHSVAFLSRTGSTKGVVFADGDGTPQRTISAKVDAGSPIGWIDDREVTYVSGGRLTAMDRQGHLRTLPSVAVDAARDTLVLAPGGRYAYLRSGNEQGRLYDLQAGTSRELAGVVAEPSFTADGAGVVWVEQSGSRLVVHYSAVNGGPTTSATLPVGPGEQISDLAVSPDGSELVYSVTGKDHRAQLLLAALPSGITLARSSTGAGESPNWSPTGRFFTVRAGAADAGRIESVRSPAAVAGTETGGPVTRAGTGGAAGATIAAFTTAQVGGDAGAQAWLSDGGSTLPQLPRVSRADLLWSQPGPAGVTTARVRLSIDPTSDHPIGTQADESITVAADTGQGPPKVVSAAVGPFLASPNGPQLLHADTSTSAGSVLLSFDSDLDEATIGTGIRVTGSDGAAVPSAVHYDATSRTVSVRPSSSRAGVPVVVTVGTGLRDVSGTPASAGVEFRFLPAG
jgi:hypothetical protein